MADIVKVQFHGDELEAVQAQGTAWVAIRRICEALGLAYAAQLAKLKTKPWAVISLRDTTGPDGKVYETACLDLDSLPMWLATIDVRRVAPEVRPKLERYQVECARVLREHFFGNYEPIAELAARVEELEAMVAQSYIRPPGGTFSHADVVRVPFYEDEVDVVPDNGTTWVWPGCIYKNLGLNASREENWLRKTSPFSTRTLLFPYPCGPDFYGALFVELESIPAWMSWASERRRIVPMKMLPKAELYRRELVGAVRAHLFGARTALSASRSIR